MLESYNVGSLLFKDARVVYYRSSRYPSQVGGHNTMAIVWTLQHPRVLDSLERGEAYRPKLSAVEKYGMIDYPKLQHAYEWMREQYSKRVKPLSPGHGLVWVWVRPKPDLRGWAREEKPFVRLTLQVDPKRILPSDHEDWHSPLNGSPVTPLRLRNLPDRLFDKWADEAYMWPPPKIEKTWTRIFDPRYFRPHVQGVMSEIRPGDVVKTERFD